MRKYIVFTLLFVSTICWAETKVDYSKSVLTVETFHETKSTTSGSAYSSGYLNQYGSYTGSTFGSTTTNTTTSLQWRGYQGGVLISSSDFFTIGGDSEAGKKERIHYRGLLDYEKKEREKWSSYAPYSWGLWGLFTVGTGIWTGVAWQSFNESFDAYNYTNQLLSLTGLLMSVAFIYIPIEHSNLANNYTVYKPYSIHPASYAIQVAQSYNEKLREK